MEQTMKDEFLGTLIKLKRTQSLLPVHLAIPLGEFLILRAAQDHLDGKDFTPVSDLIGTLPVSKPAVSQILNQLEKKGYIRRELNEHDHRRISVSLTESGKLLLETETRRFNDAFDRLFEKMGKEDMQQLLSLLRKLAEASQEVQLTP